MMSDEINLKIVVIALFYERGKTGNDVLYRESYKVPVPVTNMRNLTNFMEYLRRFTGVEKIAQSKGLGSSLEIRLAHLDSKNLRIAINTDEQLKEELKDVIESNGKDLLQLIIFPKDIVFAKNSATVVINVGENNGESSSSAKEPDRYTLTADEISEINSLLKGGSKVIKGRMVRRSITMHKRTEHVDWPYYVKCGVCSKEVALRVDGGVSGRVSNFHRKHYESHGQSTGGVKRKQNGGIAKFFSKQASLEPQKSNDATEDIDDPEVMVIEQIDMTIEPIIEPVKSSGDVDKTVSSYDTEMERSAIEEEDVASEHGRTIVDEKSVSCEVYGIGTEARIPTVDDNTLSCDLFDLGTYVGRTIADEKSVSLYDLGMEAEAPIIDDISVSLCDLGMEAGAPIVDDVSVSLCDLGEEAGAPIVDDVSVSLCDLGMEAGAPIVDDVSVSLCDLGKEAGAPRVDDLSVSLYSLGTETAIPAVDDKFVSLHDLGMDAGMSVVEEQVDASDAQLPDTITYSIEFADPLCVKFNELLSCGKISRSDILYKFLNDTVEICYNPFHQYDTDVLEFFNTVEHLGGRKTVNFIRGPMRAGQGKQKHHDIDCKCDRNLGGPCRKTRKKESSGYTTRSGVIKELSECQLKLSTHRKPDSTFLVSNNTVRVIPCVFSNDGNALKPSIEFDNRKKVLVGLNVQIDHDFVTANPFPSSEYLKEHMVVEVVISNITSLDNDSSMPVIAEYVPKKGKTGENLKKTFEQNILLVQTCEGCQHRAVAEENILLAENVQCYSTCATCLDTEKVCVECQILGHEEYLPCLRACNSCIQEQKHCVRRVVLVLCADCEDGNKKAFRNIIEDIRQNKIDPHLALLTILPDAVHVGKSLKASFANWMLLLGKARGCLGMLRSLRGRSSREVVRKMHSLLPKSDHVINRDRQDPSSVIALSKKEVTDYLKSLGYISSTIIPEISKYTDRNRVGMYPKPVDIAVANLGYVLILFNFDEEGCTSSLLKARLHCPVDKLTVIQKKISAKEVHYSDGVAYLCGTESKISVVEIIPESVSINPGKSRSKEKLVGLVSEYGLSRKGTAKQLKERLSSYVSEVAKRYDDARKGYIHFDDDYLFESIAILPDEKGHILGAVSSHKWIARVKLEFDGVGVCGTLLQHFDYGPHWSNLQCLCVSSSKIYVSHASGLSIILDFQSSNCVEIDNNETFNTDRLAHYKDGILITDKLHRKIWSISNDNLTPQLFSGTGDLVHREGPVLEASFCKPVGIAVEFDHNIFVADFGAERINIITTMDETAGFLEKLNLIYSAFSVHNKAESYVNLTLEEAGSLIADCYEFLIGNEKNVRQTVSQELPDKLKGPHGCVSAKSVESLLMIKSGLKRLKEITSSHNYHSAKPLSCLSLDVEHFHAAQHVKTEVMSMQQYCVLFGNTLRESIKKKTKWAAHYCTSEKSSWYPVPESAIPLQSIPWMKQTPPAKLDKEKECEMRTWARMYGRAVRQRSNRQQTTMASAGTLPTYIYEVRSTAPVEKSSKTSARGRRRKVMEEEKMDEVEEVEECRSDEEEDYWSDVEDIAYDSDSSLEDEQQSSESDLDLEDADDWVADLGIPSAPKETLFLVGGRSRFGRAIRLNNKFV